MTEQTESAAVPAAESPQPAAREPFVAPSVVHVGGLDVLTLVTG